MNDKRYRYLECGLDNVYLANGFQRFESARGTSIAISDIDSLHRAIGEHLCNRKEELSGKEIRFLRREMLLSQASLAHLLDVKEQTVHRWESEKSNMPGAAEALLRLLYMEQVKKARESLRSRLKRIADLEDQIDRSQEMIFALKTDGNSGRSTRREPVTWAFAG